MAPGVPVYNYYDLTLRVPVREKLELRAGVLNVADKDPPIVGDVIGQTNVGVYDIIGRQFYVGVKARF